MTRKRGQFTAEQEWLLRAALLDGREAVQAWQLWAAGVSPDHLDPGSYHLLPLVYDKLRACGVDHPMMGRLKGTQRYTWYENHIRLKRLAEVLRALQDAGIETMLLKGAALVLLFYRNPGLRTMRDFDVLVPPEQYLAAAGVIEKLGWTLRFPCPKEALAEYLPTRHANAFLDQSGSECDLHMHIFPECRGGHADDDLWESSRTQSVHGVKTRVLSPADTLLHVCAHGARSGAESALRQVADAMTILNSSPDLDWERLLLQANKRRLALPVKHMLEHLRDLFQAPIPPQILETLDRRSPSLVERIEHALKKHSAPPLHLRILQRWFQYRHYLHSPGGADLRGNPVGFARFLQRFWGLPRLRQIPLAALVKLIRRLRNNEPRDAGMYERRPGRDGDRPL